MFLDFVNDSMVRCEWKRGGAVPRRQPQQGRENLTGAEKPVVNEKSKKAKDQAKQ